MYIVTLRTLPPLYYPTIESVWDDCPNSYLDPRKACHCPRGCRCAVFDRFAQQLIQNGTIRLHAVTVTYTPDK